MSDLPPVTTDTTQTQAPAASTTPTEPVPVVAVVPAAPVREPEEKQTFEAWAIVLIATACVIILVLGGMFFYRRNKKPASDVLSTASSLVPERYTFPSYGNTFNPSQAVMSPRAASSLVPGFAAPFAKPSSMQ